MNRTGIEWCDYTWNPIVGCSPVSEGCERCYAAAIARRFHLPWGAPVFLPGRLGAPAKVKKPARVFVGSMTDLGHEGVRSRWRIEVARAMVEAPWHTYIVLTKRPGPWLRMLPPACWVGVSVETQAHSIRWNQLFAWAWPGASVKFVSVEPMLSLVSFYAWMGYGSAFPDWVIAGPETGPGARDCREWWIDHLAIECAAAGVAFFDKRKLEISGYARREWPAGLG